MSTLSALGTGAARAVGTALAVGLMMAAGGAPACALGATSPADVTERGPLKAKPGAAQDRLIARPTARLSAGVTIRLPDGRVLHFVPVPSASAPGSGSPSDGASATPTPPSRSPSDDPSVSAVPVPVVSSLFPSSTASGSPAHRKPPRSAHSSRSAFAHPSATVQTAPQTGASAAVPQGGDAVPPSAEPERPASTVPPPLGPYALLQPGALGTQIAGPRSAPVASSALAHRGLLLGVGLALIGSGAALFGWRIRRL